MSDEDKEVQEEVKADPDKVIRNHVLASMGIGLIPLPLVDLAGVTGAQLNMMRKLAKIYDIPFTDHLGKELIGSLTGSGLSMPLGRLVGSLVKFIPVVGTAAGVVAAPVAAGATTYAVGKVFHQHFESGGTFLTFNPAKVKAYFQSMYQEGEKVAADAA